MATIHGLAARRKDLDRMVSATAACVPTLMYSPWNGLTPKSVVPVPTHPTMQILSLTALETMARVSSMAASIEERAAALPLTRPASALISTAESGDDAAAVSDAASSLSAAPEPVNADAAALIAARASRYLEKAPSSVASIAVCLETSASSIRPCADCSPT